MYQIFQTQADQTTFKLVETLQNANEEDARIKCRDYAKKFPNHAFVYVKRLGRFSSQITYTVKEY